MQGWCKVSRAPKWNTGCSQDDEFLGAEDQNSNANTKLVEIFTKYFLVKR